MSKAMGQRLAQARTISALASWRSRSSPTVFGTSSVPKRRAKLGKALPKHARAFAAYRKTLVDAHGGDRERVVLGVGIERRSDGALRSSEVRGMVTVEREFRCERKGALAEIGDDLASIESRFVGVVGKKGAIGVRERCERGLEQAFAKRRPRSRLELGDIDRPAIVSERDLVRCRADGVASANDVACGTQAKEGDAKVLPRRPARRLRPEIGCEPVAGSALRRRDDEGGEEAPYGTRVDRKSAPRASAKEFCRTLTTGPFARPISRYFGRRARGHTLEDPSRDAIRTLA